MKMSGVAGIRSRCSQEKPGELQTRSSNLYVHEKWKIRHRGVCCHAELGGAWDRSLAVDELSGVIETTRWDPFAAGKKKKNHETAAYRFLLKGGGSGGTI